MVEKMKPGRSIGTMPDDMSHLDELTVINPATEQVLTTTRKVYDSIYLDKGFQIVARDNATGGNGKKTRAPEIKHSEPKSIKAGSAAEIASKLGLKTKESGPAETPAIDAETGVAGSPDAESGVMDPANIETDEINSNADIAVASEPRASSGRSRNSGN